MNGQRDEKDILSTPKRKKHHIDYTHINKNEQKELGERRITSCWTQAAFGGRQNGFVYPQRRHSVRSHMSNVVVSIVQVCTGSMWWKRIQSIPKRKSMIYFVIPKPSVIQNVVKTTYRPHTHQQKWTKWAGREKNWYWQKRTYSCNWGNRLSPFSSRWPCTDLHNWYYNIDHVKAAFGGWINLFSPPNHSLSPTRGDSSLSQLFLFIFVDVYGVYMLFWLRFEWQKSWIWQNRT